MAEQRLDLVHGAKFRSRVHNVFRLNAMAASRSSSKSERIAEFFIAASIYFSKTNVGGFKAISVRLIILLNVPTSHERVEVWLDCE